MLQNYVLPLLENAGTLELQDIPESDKKINRHIDFVMEDSTSWIHFYPAKPKSYFYFRTKTAITENQFNDIRALPENILSELLYVRSYEYSRESSPSKNYYDKKGTHQKNI